MLGVAVADLPLADLVECHERTGELPGGPVLVARQVPGDARGLGGQPPVGEGQRLRGGRERIDGHVRVEQAAAQGGRGPPGGSAPGSADRPR